MVRTRDDYFNTSNLIAKRFVSMMTSSERVMF